MNVWVWMIVPPGSTPHTHDKIGGKFDHWTTGFIYRIDALSCTCSVWKFKCLAPIMAMLEKWHSNLSKISSPEVCAISAPHICVGTMVRRLLYGVSHSSVGPCSVSTEHSIAIQCVRCHTLNTKLHETLSRCRQPGILAARVSICLGIWHGRWTLEFSCFRFFVFRNYITKPFCELFLQGLSYLVCIIFLTRT